MPVNNSESVKSQIDLPADEIELIDLLRVIWKWKYLIIGGTMAFALITAVISFFQPRIYSVHTIIEPGILKIVNDDQGRDRRVYTDTSQNMKALIDAGSFEDQISPNLVKISKNNEFPEHIHFKTSIAGNSNTLNVSYETASVEQGTGIFETPYKALEL